MVSGGFSNHLVLRIIVLLLPGLISGRPSRIFGGRKLAFYNAPVAQTRPKLQHTYSQPAILTQIIHWSHDIEAVATQPSQYCLTLFLSLFDEVVRCASVDALR